MEAAGAAAAAVRVVAAAAVRVVVAAWGAEARAVVADARVVVDEAREVVAATVAVSTGRPVGAPEGTAGRVLEGSTSPS